MSKAKGKLGSTNTKRMEHGDKKTRQGASKNTKHSASASNKASKPYRGQGR